MTYPEITEAAAIDGDKHGFANSAFQLVRRICKNGDFESLIDLEQFLLAEAAEADRRASYLEDMAKYYHENAAIAERVQAKAFRLMRERVNQLIEQPK